MKPFGEMQGHVLIEGLAAHHSLKHSVMQSVPERLARVVTSLTPEGSTVLLTGQPGSGKSQLARDAAARVAAANQTFTEVIVLNELTRTASDDVIVAQLKQRAEQHPLIVVAFELHQQPFNTSAILSAMMRLRRVRVIATASRLSGAARVVYQEPGSALLVMGPLSVAESRSVLSRVLGSEHIDSHTLRRWHALTAGNAYLLALLAISCDRLGVVHRNRGVAWVHPEDDAVPPELVDYLRSVCSERDIETLQYIATAEPVTERVLLRKLDGQSVDRLCALGLVIAEPSSKRNAALELSHDLLRAAVHAMQSPITRLSLIEEVYEALVSDPRVPDPGRVPERLLRLVQLGLEIDRDLPHHWLSIAFNMVRGEGDRRLRSALALLLAGHPLSSVHEQLAAVSEAYRYARITGDAHVADAVKRDVDRLLGEALLTPEERLEVQLIAHEYTLLANTWGEAEASLRDMQKLAQHISVLARERVRTMRVLTLALRGWLRAALEASPELEIDRDLEIEHARIAARIVATLVRQQRGDEGAAVAGLEHVRRVALLGDDPRPDLDDLLAFTSFFGAWITGDLASMTLSLAELTRNEFSVRDDGVHYTGLLDAAAALDAVARGRWGLAAQRAERLLDQLVEHDAYGLRALTQGALAFAYAVMGERAEAQRVLTEALAAPQGYGQVLSGASHLLLLRAQHWLGGEHVLPHAHELAAFAQREGLALIELAALHIVASVQVSPGRALVARASDLAHTLSQPLAEAMFAHIQRLAQTGADPELMGARQLAEHGVWLPMPHSDELSTREREIALFAALGHTSRAIGEHFHLSTRTVETHLARVYSKLGISNRTALRAWFAAQ